MAVPAPTGTLPIPVIDMSASATDTAATLHSTCSSVGFFYLDNHGVDLDLRRRVFEQSQLLFDLPEEEKLKLVDSVHSRGYTRMGEETLAPELQSKGDRKEGYYIGFDRPTSDDIPLHAPNVWPPPTLLPDFRATMEAYLEQVTALGHRLNSLLAAGLGLEPTHFQAPGMFDVPMVMLRLLSYAPEPSSPDSGVFACGEHRDYGCWTFLSTDSVPGLQVRPKGSTEWVDVPVRDGAFVVNLGEMLARWTGGMYEATLHRVVKHDTRRRFSVPVFFEPNFTCVVETLPCCRSGDGEPVFPPITSGQFLLDKYRQTHADFKGDKK